MRIILFLLTNMAVLLVFSLFCKLFGIDAVLVQNGLNIEALLLFSVIAGFAGSLLSLFMSKSIAKRSMRVQIISAARTEQEHWLVSKIAQMAQQANIAMPEVGIYEGSANAFATGPSKNNSLVAVSTGLLQAMSAEEVEAVLAHEVSHIANGDMVTMTLLQGVLNAFVIFFSRVLAYFVDALMRGKDERSSKSGPSFAYYIAVFVLEMIFGILATIIVAWFSRKREFRADAGAAQLMGQPESMIKALQRLGKMQTEDLPTTVKSFGIAGGIGSLLATHPSLEARINALRATH